jgi:transposase
MKPHPPSVAAPWRLSDPSWRRVELILDAMDPPRPQGRPRADRRRVLEGILYRLKTGRPWRRIPKAYGDDSTAHRTFIDWLDRGIFEKIQAVVGEQDPEFRRAL